MTAALEEGEWSAARPGRTLPRGKDLVPIVQEAEWAPGPVWMGRKSRPHRDSIPNTPLISTLKILRDTVKNFFACAYICIGFVHPCLEPDPEVVTSS